MATLSKAPKFYEADGAIRAMANRSWVVSAITSTIALVSVCGFIFVRMQPPTVIHILANGQAEVVSTGGRLPSVIIPSVLKNARSAEAPSEDEKLYYVRTFLDNYLNYDPNSVASNWAKALNSMTDNLSRSALAQFQNDNRIGEIQDQNIRSEMTITEIQQDPSDPLTYHIYAKRDVHHMVKRVEMVDHLVEAYKIRLTTFARSAENPYGLLVAEFSDTQISSDTSEEQFTDASTTPGGGSN